MRVLLQPKFHHFFNKIVWNWFAERELYSPLARRVGCDFFIKLGRAYGEWVQAYMFLPPRKINNIPAVHFKGWYLVANGFGGVGYNLADGGANLFKDILYIGWKRVYVIVDIRKSLSHTLSIVNYCSVQQAWATIPL